MGIFATNGVHSNRGLRRINSVELQSNRERFIQDKVEEVLAELRKSGLNLDGVEFSKLMVKEEHLEWNGTLTRKPEKETLFLKMPKDYLATALEPFLTNKICTAIEQIDIDYEERKHSPCSVSNVEQDLKKIE